MEISSPSRTRTATKLSQRWGPRRQSLYRQSKPMLCCKLSPRISIWYVSCTSSCESAWTTFKLKHASNLGGEKDYTFKPVTHRAKGGGRAAYIRSSLVSLALSVPVKHLATCGAGIMDAAELLFCKGQSCRLSKSARRGLAHVPWIYRDDMGKNNRPEIGGWRERHRHARRCNWPT